MSTQPTSDEMENACRMLRRAVFDWKHERIIEGIATTPTKNAHGYSVDPSGALWNLPIPLLWWHDWSRPIGWVVAASKSSTEVTYRAKVGNAGLPKIDETWDRIKSRQSLGVSAAFDFIDRKSDWKEFRKCAYDPHATRWHWTELSVCDGVSGANPDACIEQVKEYKPMPCPCIYLDGRPSVHKKEMVHYDSRPTVYAPSVPIRRPGVVYLT